MFSPSGNAINVVSSFWHGELSASTSSGFFRTFPDRGWYLRTRWGPTFRPALVLNNLDFHHESCGSNKGKLQVSAPQKPDKMIFFFFVQRIFGGGKLVDWRPWTSKSLKHIHPGKTRVTMGCISYSKSWFSMANRRSICHTWIPMVILANYNHSQTWISLTIRESFYGLSDSSWCRVFPWESCHQLNFNVADFFCFYLFVLFVTRSCKENGISRIFVVFFSGWIELPKLEQSNLIDPLQMHFWAW